MGICPPTAARRTTLQPHTEICAIAATHNTREVTSNGFLTLGIISTVLALHRNYGPRGRVCLLQNT